MLSPLHFAGSAIITSSFTKNHYATDAVQLGAVLKANDAQIKKWSDDVRIEFKSKSSSDSDYSYLETSADVYLTGQGNQEHKFTPVATQDRQESIATFGKRVLKLTQELVDTLK